MFTRGSLPGPSNSGPPVATPPQMGNRHQNLNMGSVSHPSKSGSTPTRRDNQHQMMGSDCTPPRQYNQQQMMGSDSTPTRRYNQHQMMGSSSAPTRQYNRYQMMSSDSSPTRRDNQRQMTGLTPTRHYIPHLNPGFQYNQSQMMVDPFASLNSGMPAMNPTHQDSARQMLPTGLLPSPSFFGAGVHTSPPSSNAPVAPARTRQGIPHGGLNPELVNIHEGTGQESSGAPTAGPTQGKSAPPKPSAVPSNIAKVNTQETSIAPVVTPTRQMIAPPKPDSDPSRMPKLPVQEGFGGPIATTTRQENTTPKSTKAQQALKVSAPAKPESATPKASMAKSQKPGAADPKTQKSDVANPKAGRLKCQLLPTRKLKSQLLRILRLKCQLLPTRRLKSQVL